MPKLIVAVVLVAVTSVHAQNRGPANWTPSRTSDGHPDLQGIWTMQTFTPLQRPARYAGKEFLTEAEAAELTKLLTQDGVDPLAGDILGLSDDQRLNRVRQNDPTHYNNADWLTAPQPKALSSNRTSLIVDPPDGRIPPLTPEARQRLAARQALAGFDSYENRPLPERCMVWAHEGPPMLPPPYDDITQIMQVRGYVVIMRELSTNPPRIIPTTGGPHLPNSARQWSGDSRGHWEGDTLVVDTTNYNDRVAFQGSTSALHVIERFTRVSEDRILYRFTVDDPNTWTKPWSAEIPLLHATGHAYEYACHEGNYGLVNTLKGARAADRKTSGQPSRDDGKPVPIDRR